jgi:hypothetical protein
MCIIFGPRLCPADGGESAREKSPLAAPFCAAVARTVRPPVRTPLNVRRHGLQRPTGAEDRAVLLWTKAAGPGHPGRPRGAALAGGPRLGRVAAARPTSAAVSRCQSLSARAAGARVQKLDSSGSGPRARPVSRQSPCSREARVAPGWRRLTCCRWGRLNSSLVRVRALPGRLQKLQDRRTRDGV